MTITYNKGEITMKKQVIKNVAVVATTLAIGFASFSPSYASALSATPKPLPVIVEQKEEFHIQIEEQVTGVIEYFYGKELLIKDKEGKRYQIFLNYFSHEQIEKMNLAEGKEISIEGQFISIEELNSFEYYKIYLPEGITEEELAVIEQLYNDIKALEAEKKYDETMDLWDQIHQIVEPYYIAAWEPETFEEFFLGYEGIEITDEDLAKLKGLYEEYVSLRKALEVEASNEKMNEFYNVLQPYFDYQYETLTFEQYMEGYEFEIEAEDLKKLETLFNEAMAADKNEDWEVASDKWSAFHDILQPYFLEHYQPPTFEEFLSFQEFELTAEDIAIIKPLYEKATSKEKEGDWEGAMEYWEELHEVLNPYYETLRPAYMKASQVVIDGVSFLID